MRGTERMVNGHRCRCCHIATFVRWVHIVPLCTVMVSACTVAVPEHKWRNFARNDHFDLLIFVNGAPGTTLSTELVRMEKSDNTSFRKANHVLLIPYCRYVVMPKTCVCIHIVYRRKIANTHSRTQFDLCVLCARIRIAHSTHRDTRIRRCRWCLRIG